MACARYIQIVVVAIALASCVSTSSIDDLGGVKSTTSTITDTISKDKSALKRIQEYSKAAFAKQKLAIADPLLGEYSGPPQLIAYLHSILAELQGSSPLPVPEVEITARDCAPFQDDTRINRVITLCFSTLAALSSESELAFLVGHELCHQILGHPAELAEKIASFRKANGLAYFFTGPFGSPFFETNGANEIAQIRRAQEIDADRCSQDLVSKSRFNTNGAIAFLELLDQTELNSTSNQLALAKFQAESNERTKERVDELSPALRAVAYGLMVMNFADPNAPGRLYQAYGLNDSTHPKAAVRLKDAKVYLSRHYQGSTGRGMLSLPWDGSMISRNRDLGVFFHSLKESNETALRLAVMFANNNDLKPGMPLISRKESAAILTATKKMAGSYQLSDMASQLREALKGPLKLHARSRARMAFLAHEASRRNEVSEQYRALMGKKEAGFSFYVLWAFELESGDAARSILAFGWNDLQQRCPEFAESIMIDVALMFKELGDEGSALNLESECRKRADRAIAELNSKMPIKYSEENTRLTREAFCGIPQGIQRIHRNEPREVDDERYSGPSIWSEDIGITVLRWK